jgi:hypothetical protein
LVNPVNLGPLGGGGKKHTNMKFKIDRIKNVLNALKILKAI